MTDVVLPRSPATPLRHSHATPARQAIAIAACAEIAAAPAAVFAFLADLENHWHVADRWVDVRSLQGPPGARWGGSVVVRGPLGLRRAAQTRVLAASFPRALVGAAVLSGGTRARVTWTLDDVGLGTRIELKATVQTPGRLDRLLLRAGGARWLERRFAATLGLLGARFTPADAMTTATRASGKETA